MPHPTKPALLPNAQADAQGLARRVQFSVKKNDLDKFSPLKSRKKFSFFMLLFALKAFLPNLIIIRRLLFFN